VTPPLDALAFRRGTTDDAARLAAVLVEGFATYKAFAPPGWQPPPADDVAGVMEPQLARPTVWCLLAERDSRVAGYVAFLPVAESRRPIDNPRLAHFWMLFVRSPWWGSALARHLHRAACDAAAERGFTEMRLFTPAGQSRARRFYERERWRLDGEPYVDEELGLTIVEYRRTLP
jgi:GNAT superfamily N-acetyltransferase